MGRLSIPRRSAALLGVLFASTALAARPLVSPEGQERPPKLVAKAKGTLIHAVPYPHGQGRGLPDAPGGILLLHTRAETGEMKQLLASGTFAYPTRRQSWSHSRIVGIAADDERVYVLVWATRGYDRVPPPEQMPRERATYTLIVFRLADGELVYRGPPDNVNSKPQAGTPPAEVLEKGPLEVVKGGVKIDGVEVRVR